jgi:hypothetical protein
VFAVEVTQKCTVMAAIKTAVKEFTGAVALPSSFTAM